MYKITSVAIFYLQNELTMVVLAPSVVARPFGIPILSEHYHEQERLVYENDHSDQTVVGEFTIHRYNLTDFSKGVGILYAFLGQCKADILEKA